MSDKSKPQLYREVIDALVEMCHSGQGQIGARRAREGVWNRNATPDFIPEQHEINEFLASLSPEDREVLARMLASAVETGVFETLKALEEFGVAPFESGYEGSAYEDFVGRLDGWEWPAHSDIETHS